MADHFESTAEQMYEAGVALAELQPRNSCYLLGYVAECVMKATLARAWRENQKSETDISKAMRSASHSLQKLRAMSSMMGLLPSVRLSLAGDLFRSAPMMSSLVVRPEGMKEHRDPGHRYDGASWESAAMKEYLSEALTLLRIQKRLQLDGAL